ncbi:MAG: nitrogen fixation/metabolism regulation signal transduction histidine kinase [Arenicella sp.]|jgi:nitrogen fixation/metabolism regulation signal transduction histidine kinase
MAIRSIVKKISSPLPVITVCTGLLFALSYLIVRSLSDDASGELQFWITIIGSLGIATLVFFLASNGYTLLSQYRRNEIGSILTAKMVVIFFFLTMIPFSLIYFFSIQFLNKGVDSWFDVRIEQTVKDSLLLSQSALEGIKEEVISDVERIVVSIRQNQSEPANELLAIIRELRAINGLTELSLYTDEGRVLAFSSNDQANILPSPLSAEIFSELRLNQTYTQLEPISPTMQQFRVVAPIAGNQLGRQFYGVQAIKLLPLRYATLASSVETVSNQYAQMVFARGPLKFSLIVTLSLISLASLLFSILTAVYLSRRLVAPISNLASGTQKIAEGNYGSHLPVTSSDELGILTKSFNNMSSKISEAQQIALASQTETEQQKGYLEAVLTNLSSGVFSFDGESRLQICNSAASEILGLEQDTLLSKTAEQLCQPEHHAKQFFELINAGIKSKQNNWQDELTLLGTHGRQMLIIRGTVLRLNNDLFEVNAQVIKPIENYVIVFDDVTNLIQAQRDAAWGEVARRLAHEIKNPLTPIQLSAERIKLKLYDHVDGELQETLERSTRTIVQQVESMKEMVNAFSSYAQPVRAKLAPLNINQLVRDVLELHSSHLHQIEIKLELDDNVTKIKANASALRQVLNNLVINASHALEKTAQPMITISTQMAAKVTGEYIDLLVEDNGSGIPEDIRESLFDPYVSSKAKGSGLGLAIVKRIVEEHSGSVWARQGSNGGTAMHLRLPINAMKTYRGNRRQNSLHSIDINPAQTTD